jgi:hypothetical protein
MVRYHLNGTIPHPRCMQAAPALLSTTMQISGQLEWPTMNNEQNDDAIPPWSHLEGTPFWCRVDREMCLLWLLFTRVFTFEQWSQTMSMAASGTNRNDADQDGPGGLTELFRMTSNMDVSHWESRFLHNRAKLYDTTALSRYFVCAKSICYVHNSRTGTSVLCISIVYVHHAHYFINTTSILLCLWKINTSICYVHNLLRM